MILAVTFRTSLSVWPERSTASRSPSDSLAQSTFGRRHKRDGDEHFAKGIDDEGCSSYTCVRPLFRCCHGAELTFYVTSAGATNGFTDPNKDNRDTVEDLVKKLKGKKMVSVVQSQEEAKVVVVVMNRELSSGGHGGLWTANARDVTVRIKLLVDGVEADMSASSEKAQIGSGGAWGRAASKLANQIEDWVKANRARLMSS